MVGAIEFLQDWQSECKKHVNNISGAELRECENCKIKKECKSLVYNINKLNQYELTEIVKKIRRK